MYIALSGDTAPEQQAVNWRGYLLTCSTLAGTHVLGGLILLSASVVLIAQLLLQSGFMF